MNNLNSESHNSPDDEMLPEYDFSKGIRGKHYQSYRQGHSLTIHQEDGTTIVQHFILEDGAVMLDPDVQQYFPDSESVNDALRNLIPSLPQSAKIKPLKSGNTLPNDSEK